MTIIRQWSTALYRWFVITEPVTGKARALPSRILMIYKACDYIKTLQSVHRPTLTGVGLSAWRQFAVKSTVCRPYQAQASISVEPQ